MEYIVACVIVTAVIYALVFLTAARHVALNELDNRRYPPYNMGEYAGAGIWGLLIGAFWPVLAVAIVFGAAVGWLLTRFVKTNRGRA